MALEGVRRQMSIWPALARRIARRNPDARLKLRPSVGKYLTIYDPVVKPIPSMPLEYSALMAQATGQLAQNFAMQQQMGASTQLGNPFFRPL